LLARNRFEWLAPAPESADRMIDLKAIDDLARRLSELVPPGLKDAGAELEQNMKATLQAGLAKLDLVTREEFEVQRAVLLRTREKLDALEKSLAALEAKQQS
jgi:BMFP domain-containing protein YqiC